jgi:hypothetical protein
MTDLIGSREAADILGWSLAKVKREALNGALPVALKMEGNTGAYLFERSAIAAKAEEVAA